MPKTATQFDSLSQRKNEAKQRFIKRHPDAHSWLEKKGLTLESIREHSAKLLTGATLGGSLLLSSPVFSLLNPVHAPQVVEQPLSQLMQQLKDISANNDAQKEVEINKNIFDMYGVSTQFELEGHRLPHYRGRIGLEQHLLRFPLDSINQHDAYLETGIAPSRGAFGYFFETGKPEEVAIQQEKYYVVLQTFLIPNWNTDWTSLKKWYKFRKFLVINPENGQAVVAVLGDSGPGETTGKVFGGSPEVMKELGIYPKKTSDQVIFLFIDDPNNIIPLGPVAPKGART